jgi:hypothetical protein
MLFCAAQMQQEKYWQCAGCRAFRAYIHNGTVAVYATYCACKSPTALYTCFFYFVTLPDNYASGLKMTKMSFAVHSKIAVIYQIPVTHIVWRYSLGWVHWNPWPLSYPSFHKTWHYDLIATTVQLPTKWCDKTSQTYRACRPSTYDFMLYEQSCLLSCSSTSLSFMHLGSSTLYMKEPKQ